MIEIKSMNTTCRRPSRRDVLTHGSVLFGLTLAASPAFSASAPDSQRAIKGSFPLITGGLPAAIFIDPDADPALHHVADRFCQDLQRVCGKAPQRIGALSETKGPVVIIGVIGKSEPIDELAKSGRLNAGDLSGQWEAFRQTVISNPFPGVSSALVISGSDRRGAVFGTYDLSERIGVSAWHWFADVPVATLSEFHVPPGTRRDQPKVRYRGFFINDEDPCFSGWAKKKFGGINASMYAHVFELLLRMKGNYLWPAMWAPKAFATDDPQNIVLADAMGVVMGSSHHEVMMRAQAEWHQKSADGIRGGPWDYRTNAENLRAFWRGGIERMMSKGNGQPYESVVTIGMRGDGDEAMAEGTATELLETIVADQRHIIADVTGKPADQTPQVWALYKEVQDYYDHGMKVPDDVILLFADDNWGQIRKLPALDAAPRKGGYGVYYHFDYVGVPRDYKWLNTNQIEKVWQQMNLAYERNARSMWIANVGDIKPMEYPLGFFLAMAWDPELYTPEKLAAYPVAWAGRTFGAEHAAELGEVITLYSKYAARRKPELIDPTTFQLGDATPEQLDGGEFGALVQDWEELEDRMIAVRDRLPQSARPAYFQLVEYPISAMSNLYRMYYAAAWNTKLASQNDPRANHFADQVEATFQRDKDLVAQYHAVNNSKWDGMMAQVHMSYVTWADPTQQTMPTIMRVGGDTPADRLRPQIKFAPRTAPSPDVHELEAASFYRAHTSHDLAWQPIPNLGRNAGAMVCLPQGRPATSPADQIYLEYDVEFRNAGQVTLIVQLAPTLDTFGKSGLRLGVSLDNEDVHTLTANLEATGGAQDTPDKQHWAQCVRNNVIKLTARLGAAEAGRHSIKVWRIDDNVVLEKLVVSTSDVPDTYL